MSTAQSFQPGHATGSGQSSNGLTLNLSSNNPFRNRAASPASLESPFVNKPASPFDDPPSQLRPLSREPPPRPLSRNPFLDNAPPPLRSPGVMSTQSDSKSLSAEEIFDSLTLDDKNDGPKPPPGGRRPMDRPPPRRPSDHMRPPPPNGQARPPPRSQEEAMRARRMQAGGGPRPHADSPQRKGPPPAGRRPRRNSESSLVDFDAQPLTADEKRMIEAKRREKLRAAGGGGGGGGGTRGADPSAKKEAKHRPSRRVDIIDQLDATGIYGTGLFHHDGPFDALNPHRNRATSRRAPMQAFPEGSLNNSLGGAGPLNTQADHSAFMGLGNDEAFRDYATGGKTGNGYNAKRQPEIFDSTVGSTAVHGDESYGLGTSTFLEGTPAARSAIVRSQVEQTHDNMEGGGLQRKKSLAQRFRGMNKPPRDYNNANRLVADGGYTKISPETTPSTMSTGSDNNPFFSDYGKGEEAFSARPRGQSPPTGSRRPSVGLVLERRATSEATTKLDEGAGAKPAGLLGRMKSLKGGRRPRAGSTGPSTPGTAV